MRRFLLAVLILFVATQAEAANRFWNPYIVSGAVSGTGGVCRLTISPAIVGSGLIATSPIVVTSVGGATGCNVTTTVSTVVDTTHIELAGTTFGGSYTSGGCVSGGQWTSTNTSNWAASSTATCGSGGSTVPGASDVPILDANSLTGTVVVNQNFNVTSMTTSAFTGTLDFSVNNNSPTFTIWTDTGSGAHTVKCGTGTFTFTATTGALWQGGGASLTLNCASSTWAFSAATPTGNRSVSVGTGYTYGTMLVSGASSLAGSFNFYFNTTAATTFTNFSVTAPMTIYFGNSNTITITNGPTLTGTASAPINLFSGGSVSTQATLAVGSNPTLSWVNLYGIKFTTSTSGTAINAIDMGNNGGITITPPSFGGGHVIGG